MLKFVTETIPEGLENYYTPQDDGKFRLKVEGVVPQTEYETLKTKVKEFRDTNTTLLKEKEKFQSFSSVFGGGDLNAEKIEERISSLAQQRADSLVQNMKVSSETKIKELETVLSKSNERLSKLVLDNEVTKVATEHGVLSTALEDVMLRAKLAFTVDNGEVKFREEKLDAEGKPYNIATWIAEQKTKAPHLFAQSQGTGPKRPQGSGTRVSGESVTGIDRISAAFANRNNSSAKKLN